MMHMAWVWPVGPFGSSCGCSAGLFRTHVVLSGHRDSRNQARCTSAVMAVSRADLEGMDIDPADLEAILLASEQDLCLVFPCEFFDILGVINMPASIL